MNPDNTLRPRSGSAGPLGNVQPLTEDERTAKYNRLLNEYSTIKKKTAILKKAVIQEKEKNEQNEKLLKDKELQIRSQLLTIDSLEFSNTRLTKTVTALQEEVQEASKNSGSWFGGSKKLIAQKDDELNVLRNELQAKIQENANLHTRISDLKKESRDASELLQAKIISTKGLLSAKENEFGDLKQTLEADSQRFQETNQKYETTIQELTSVVKSLESQLKSREQSLNETTKRLQQEIQSLQSSLEMKLKINDTKDASLNAFNLPPFQKERQSKLGMIAERGWTALHVLSNSYSDYYAGFSERLIVANKGSLTEQLKTVNRKIINLGPENGKHMKILEEFFQIAMAKIAAQEVIPRNFYEDVCNAMSKWISFRKGLLGCDLLRLEEESKQTNCTSSMQSRNSMLSETHYQIQYTLEQLSASMKKALLPENPAEMNKTLSELAASFTALEKSYKTLHTQFGSKVSQEAREDPFMSNTTKELHESIVHSISGISMAFGTLSDCVSDLAHFLCSPSTVPVRGFVDNSSNSRSITVGTLAVLQQRSLSYLSAVQSLSNNDDEKFISYSQSQENAKDLQTATEQNEKLQQTVESSEAKFKSLEETKNALEADLTTSKDVVAAKQAQVSSLLVELSNIREKVDKLNQIYEQTHGEKSSLEKELQKSRAEYEVLSRNLQNMKPKTISKDASQQTIAEETTVSEVTAEENESSPADAGEQPNEIVNNNSTPESPAVGLHAVAEESQAPIESPILPSNEMTNEEESVVQQSTDSIQSEEEPVEKVEEQSENNAASLEIPNHVAKSSPSIILSPRFAQGKMEQQQPFKLKVLDSTGSEYNSLAQTLSTVDVEREKALKEYYDGKAKQMMEQMQRVDAKSVQIYLAYKQSLAKLQHISQEKESLSDQMKQLEGQLQGTKEDYELTRANYEMQMNVLTEHISTQSEQISSQSNEIAALKSLMKGKR